MAYMNIARSSEWGIAQQIKAYFDRMSDQRRRGRVYRETVDELRAMSDRDLADIGVHRSTIEEIAMKAAFGD